MQANHYPDSRFPLSRHFEKSRKNWADPGQFLMSGGVVFLSAFLTALMSVYFLLLLNQSGIIAFTGSGWMVRLYNLTTDYLGYSILFFVPVLLGYVLFFVFLKRNLARYRFDSEALHDIRFYNGCMEISITLFFGIGVLFTAWGLQNALASAIGGVTKEEAASFGAWGILQRLVTNGILIALWTTIVGGIGGYGMRLFKHLLVGKDLSRALTWGQEQDRAVFLHNISTIKQHVQKIEARLSQPEPDP